MANDGFIYTTAIRKIRQLKGRKKVIQGSTSAAKTYGIIAVLIDRAIKKKKLKITVVAETIPAVKDGCVDIFKTIMQDTNRWIEEHWIGNPMEYTFSSGSRIQFKSFDTIGKAKAAGKRDILFINEGNHIIYAIADTLMVRSKETYIDFNADEEFWAHTEVLNEPNSDFLKLTYLDNEALPSEILEELMIKKAKAFFDPDLPRPQLFEKENIKSAYWANWWRVYGEGEIGSYSDRNIYSFSVVKNVPDDAIRIPSGMDFGKSPDPSILNNYWYKDGELYLDTVWIENNLEPEKIEGSTRMSIVDKMDAINFEKNQMIIGDSSGRIELKDLAKHGYNVRGVKKGPGSVLLGMKRLGAFHVNITERSTQAIQDFRTWLYDVDDNGKIIPEPPDAHEPETVVSTRYVAMARPLWEHLIPKTKQSA